MAYRRNGQGETIIEITFADASKRKPIQSDSPEEVILLETPSEPTHGLTDLLIAHGVSKKSAADLVSQFPEEDIRLQLAYLPHAEDVKNPGAYLRRAIENGFGPPKDYIASQKRAQRTQKRQHDIIPIDEAKTRQKALLTQLRAKWQARPEAWNEITTEAVRLLPLLIRSRPTNPAYGPTLEKQIDEILLRRNETEQQETVIDNESPSDA